LTLLMRPPNWVAPTVTGRDDATMTEVLSGAATAPTETFRPAINHRALADLEVGMDDIRRSPADAGTLELIVARPTYAERSVLDEARLDLTEGLVADSWVQRPSRSSADGGPDPLKQLNVMSSRVIAQIAGERANWAGAGDQLYVDLDLSHDNLPAGTQLLIGEAVIEITEPPHTGCAKFRHRYGADAIRFINSVEGRALRMRGLCARVVMAGTIRPGDPVVKLQR